MYLQKRTNKKAPHQMTRGFRFVFCFTTLQLGRLMNASLGLCNRTEAGVHRYNCCAI